MKSIKNISLLILCLLAFSSFTSVQNSTYSGKWKGEDKGEIGYLLLSKDGYATFMFEGKSMGGKSYTQKGVNASMKYIINSSTNPHTIDFVIKNNTTKKELGRLKGILELLDHDKLNLAIGFGGAERPKDFSTNALVFNRVK